MQTGNILALFHEAYSLEDAETEAGRARGVGPGEVGGVWEGEPLPISIWEGSKTGMREVTRALSWARTGLSNCFPGSLHRFQPVQGARAAPAGPSPLPLPPSAASGTVIDAVIGARRHRAN